MSFFSSLGKALKSKTVWAGIGTAALGVGQIAAPYAPQILQFIPAGTPVGAVATIALGAMTIYGRVRAKQPLGPVIDDTVARSVEALHQLREQPLPSVAVIDAVAAMVKKPVDRSNGGD
jgi:hypothetical protein